MFEERDHVHTLLYNFDWEYRRDPDGVRSSWRSTTPIGLRARLHRRAPMASPTRSCGPGYATNTCPVALPAPTPTWSPPSRPIALEMDAPGDVPREAAKDNRTLLLWFLSTPPEVAWEPVIAEHRRRLEAAGKGRGRRVALHPDHSPDRHLHRQTLGRLKPLARISTCGTMKTPSSDAAQRQEGLGNLQEFRHTLKP